MYYVIFTDFKARLLIYFYFLFSRIGVVDIFIKIEKVFVFEHRWADGTHPYGLFYLYF